MARYKSEALYRRYRRRPRPVPHYLLGWLPRWARLASRVPRLVNAPLRWPGPARLLLRAGGLDPRRTVPPFAARPFHRTVRRPPAVAPGRPRVLLWVDTFGDAFAPAVPAAALAVLADAGYEVLLPDRPACCGLTWISTGQLAGARARLRRLLDQLAPHAAAGTPIVGLEPSCTAVLRSDLLDLLPDDPRAALVAGATRTVAELLTADTPAGWTPPDLSDVTAVVQPHCHQHAVLGFGPDRELLERAGATITTLAGCCGLAGNFGMERGHYDTSVAVAENALLPALRAAAPGTVYLADGFSCRTQAAHLAGVEGTTLVELLAARLPPPPDRRSRTSSGARAQVPACARTRQLVREPLRGEGRAWASAS